MKHLLRRHLPFREMLLAGISAYSLQFRAVGAEPVAPIIGAHRPHRRFHGRAEPWQRQPVGRAEPGVAQPCDRHIARFNKRVVERARQPGILVRQCLSHRCKMHDRKEPGLGVIGFFRLLEVGKKADDARIAMA